MQINQNKIRHSGDSKYMCLTDFFFSLNNINYTALLRLFGNVIKVVNLIFIEFN